MNDRAPVQLEWSTRKWGLIISGLFLAQLGMIFSVAEYHATVARPQTPRPSIHLVTGPTTSRQLARSFFASDPTLFSSASLHGFSGPAWLRIPPPEYALPDRNSSVRWLGVDVGQLGTLSEASLSRLSLPLQPGTLAGPKIEHLPFLRTEDQARTQSVAHVTGDLALRRPELPQQLPCWPAPTDLVMPMINNSIIELAADNSGDVVATRLRASSGLDAADAEALRVARTLHFTPMPSSKGTLPQMTWGNLIVEWQTALPPETNTATAKIP